MPPDVSEGILLAQTLSQFCERRVLSILIGQRVGTFKLNANREIIALLTAVQGGHPSMPGASIAGHKLCDMTLTVNEKMRGNFQIFQVDEPRICVDIDSV